jgi:hypothetical protein
LHTFPVDLPNLLLDTNVPSGCFSISSTKRRLLMPICTPADVTAQLPLPKPVALPETPLEYSPLSPKKLLFDPKDAPSQQIVFPAKSAGVTGSARAGKIAVIRLAVTTKGTRFPIVGPRFLNVCDQQPGLIMHQPFNLP